MTATQAIKAYAALTPAERFSLFAAADARRDDQECDRVRDACRKKSRTLTDLAPRLLAFHIVSERHRQTVLEAAGAYLAERTLSLAFSPADGQTQWEAIGARSRLAAYLLQLNLAGWTRFCEQIAVPPDYACFSSGEPPDKRPGEGLLGHAKRQLADTTYLTLPSEAEIPGILARLGIAEDCPLVTAESIAARLHYEYDEIRQILE